MTLKYNDLKDCIYPDISVDEYQSKAGHTDEIIVVGFYAIEEDAAEDLDDYLEKSWIDMLDVDVSPNPTEEGRYMVFIELERNQGFFEQLKQVIGEVENLSGKMKWNVSVRGSDQSMPYDIEMLRNYVDVTGITMIDGEPPVEESIAIDDALECIKETRNDAEIVDGKIHVVGMYLDVIDIGNADHVVERNTNMAVDLDGDSYETIMLKRHLGCDWEIMKLKEGISLQRLSDDKILLVRV